jgi:hypothetical protein
MDLKYPFIEKNKNKSNNYLNCTKNIFALQNNQNNYKKLPAEIKMDVREKNSLIQGGINFFCPHSQKGHLRSMSSIYENSKYRENYIERVQNLKENFDSPIKNHKDQDKGFKYYEIPRVDLSKNIKNYRVRNIQSSIEKSLRCSNQNSFDENIDILTNKENYRLNDYMKKLNFLNFGSKNEEKDIYPSIFDFQKMEKLRLNKLKLGNNKFMGFRYNSNSNVD